MIGNVFWLVSSEGVPLEVILGRFRDRGLVMDWLDFYDQAIKEGWNPGSTKTKIETSVGEVYGPHYRDQVMLRLRALRP